MVIDRYYTLISPLYNLFAIQPYKKYRNIAIKKLNLKNGDIVIEIGSGTGVNLVNISNLIGKNGILYAIEPSVGMYNKAKNVVLKNNLSNVVLLNITIDDFIEKNKHLLNENNLKILATLVFSVLPNWQNTLNNILNNIQKQSIMVIMDLYKEKKSLFSFIIDKLAFSNINRKIWEIFEQKKYNFTLEKYRLCCYFGIECFIVKAEV